MDPPPRQSTSSYEKNFLFQILSKVNESYSVLYADYEYHIFISTSLSFRYDTPNLPIGDR